MSRNKIHFIDFGIWVSCFLTGMVGFGMSLLKETSTRNQMMVFGVIAFLALIMLLAMMRMKKKKVLVGGIIGVALVILCALFDVAIFVTAIPVTLIASVVFKRKRDIIHRSAICS